MLSVGSEARSIPAGETRPTWPGFAQWRRTWSRPGRRNRKTARALCRLQEQEDRRRELWGPTGVEGHRELPFIRRLKVAMATRYVQGWQQTIARHNPTGARFGTTAMVESGFCRESQKEPFSAPS